MYLATMIAGPALAAATALTPGDLSLAAQVQTTEVSVLTYNVRGLPWPLARGRGEALKAIGAELAAMRREGRQPDVVLIQEGFRAEVGDLIEASGYRYWARGPGRSERAEGAPPEDGRRYRPVRHFRSGEGWGKLTGAGLHVLSDAPILDVRSAPYRYCAGLDCLANKGAMLARLALPGAPAAIDVVNTHLNSKRAAKVPLARSLQAHNLQTEELLSFIADHRADGAPLLVGGDFNVKNAPERYDHRAAARPYKVVSEFCNSAAGGCQGQAPATQPWLRSQDLQAFGGAGPVQVRPVRVETVFGPGPKGRLSDHDGYLVRYRLSWDPASVAAAAPRAPVQVRPQMGTWGVKVSWKP
jgi:endonuclease/exonuclease/phosphatase family metal-dependent hydrolase